ncbi:MAG: response regulator [Planctomycetia bacterium]|nr:response regulator [Planctomycetia bacterium]
MEKRLVFIDLAYEQDVVSASQQARQISQSLGFDTPDQVRISAIVSDVARLARQCGKGATVEIYIDDLASDFLYFRFYLPDSGTDAPATRRLDRAEELLAARRMMDEFDSQVSETATTLTFAKKHSRKGTMRSTVRVEDLQAELAKFTPRNIYQEYQAQNQELLHALSELRANQATLAQLNRELEETNRGVVALYAELEQKAESLRQAGEQKTRFYSGVSHEFRTPINSILSLSQMLLDGLDGTLGTEQTKQVSLIKKSAHNLIGWVNDLLDLAKVDAGRMVVRSTWFYVDEMMTGLRGIMRPLLVNPNVTLVFDDSPSIKLYTDEGKLAQILRNFISNALKFTDAGEVRVGSRPDAERPDWIRFFVSDTGVGLAAADHERIFEEFVQVENRLQGRSKGTGLGLALSKRFAELLGGSISVVSEPGRGSTFSVGVPIRWSALDFAELADPAEQEPSSFVELPAREEPTDVLIVDDNDAARYVLRKGLEEYGLKIIEASSGRQGLEMIDALKPKIVFLDLNMPDMHGSAVLEAVRNSERTRDVPIVIYSSQVLKDSERRDLERHVVAVLRKEEGTGLQQGRKLRDILTTVGLNDRPERRSDELAK